MSDAQTPVQRPNGKVYRPRKLVATTFTDLDGDTIGVVVLGTHNIEVAQPLAQDALNQWDWGYIPCKAQLDWWRGGIRRGEPQWISDPARGRAAVVFEITEPTA